MNNQTPLISVIIPTYNRAQYISEAIDSVLDQEYPAIELIVVDDGSTDGSADIIKQYGQRLTYIYQPNAGVCAARNTGVAHSSGAFLAFLDSDDFWTAGKLTKQMGVFSAEPTTDVVFGHAIQFIDKSAQRADAKQIRNLNKPMPAELAATILIKRELFDRTQGFDEKKSILADVNWMMCLKDINPKIVMLPDTFLHRRIHGSNMSMQHKALKEQKLMEALRSRIKRKQQSTQTVQNQK